VEIWDRNVDPQTAFFSAPPVFTTTVNSTSFRYGPEQPLLLSNKRYAWQVQAKAKRGAEDIGLFKNNGFSEVYWFDYTVPCTIPQNISHEVKGKYKANFYWDTDINIISYTLRMPKKMKMRTTIVASLRTLP